MGYSSVFRETYQSQLGTLELRMNSSNQSSAAESRNGVFATNEHEIAIKTVVPQLDWLPAGMHVECAQAWLFYITKRRVGDEQLSFSIELQLADTAVQCGPDTGESLVAVEFENGIRQMHIGTEDEEVMAYRASISDYMPARLEPFLSKFETEITTITPQGLITRIPALEMGERFYFHYVIAENPCLPSADYPGEMDISTWLAVEQSKKQLEKSWRAQS